MDLELFRKELCDLRAELLDRVERTHRHIYNREERVSANFSDQSQELENQDLVQILDVEGREELRLIEEALTRIDDGSFGQCQTCGEDIQPQRLAAIPYTRYCIACASKMENTK